MKGTELKGTTGSPEAPSGRSEAIDELRASERKYKLLSSQLEDIIDAIPGLVFYKDTRNKFIRVNKYLADAHKKSKPELEGVSLYELYPREEAEKYYQDDLAVLATGIPRLNIEEQWDTTDGTRWVSTSKIPLKDDNGEMTGIIGISLDITERKQSEKLIQKLIQRLEKEKAHAQKNALTDGLTGLLNRRHFDEGLKKEFARAKRLCTPLALIMIDIDHFKNFNDRYGHLVGDDCLRQVATTLKTLIGRAPDFVARYGGEEFVVVLPDTDLDGASIVAERLRKAVAALGIPHDKSDAASMVTISLGIAEVHPEVGGSTDELIEMADKALYRAKQNGRNRCEIAVEQGEAYEAHPRDTGSFVRLVWHPSDACGNPLLDSQHQRLYMLANQVLADKLTECEGRTCIEHMAKLVVEIERHFKDEEEILSSIGYPGAAEHRQIHADLVSKAKKLMGRMAADDLSLGDLFNFIADDMISKHMIVEDRKFFPFIVSEIRGKDGGHQCSA